MNIRTGASNAFVSVTEKVQVLSVVLLYFWKTTQKRKSLSDHYISQSVNEYK